MSTHVITWKQIEESACFAIKKSFLGSAEKSFLILFASNRNLSAYGIYVYLRRRKPMIYKNVNSRVRRLHKMNLIERVEMGSKRGAKYYRLSLLGIFCLLYEKPPFNIGLLREILLNYPDNVIFAEFLYPFFENNTILKIENEFIRLLIMMYLCDCCQQIIRIVETCKLHSKLFGNYTKRSIFTWQKVPGADSDTLVRYLRTKFGLDWMDKAEIRKRNDGNTLVFSDGINSLRITLNHTRTAAAVINSKNQIFELIVEPTTEGIFHLAQPVDIEEAFMNWLSEIIEGEFVKLIFSIVSRQLLAHDSEILRQDKKFIGFVNTKLTKFIHNCNRMVETS